MGHRGEFASFIRGNTTFLMPGGFDVIRYSPSEAQHLNATMRIHDAEPYRITCSRAEYQTLFTLPKLHTFLAMKEGEVAAYLIIGEGVNKPGLVEGGGDMAGLETLVRHVLLEWDFGQEIQVLIPLTPSALGQLLEAKKLESGYPIEEASGIGYQMMRVNHLEMLLRQIQNHLRRKFVGLRGDVCLVCSETGEAVTLKFRDGNIDISSKQSPNTVKLTRR